MLYECKKCHQNLEYDAFHKDKNQKNGIHYYCKNCRKEINKKLNYEVSVEFKICSACKKELPKDMFNKSRHNISGLQNACKECSHLKMRKYYEGNGIDGFLKKLIRNAKHNSDKKGKIEHFELNFDELKELYVKQKGLCAITDIKMTYLSYKSNNARECSKYNISIDRIDSSKYYTIDNIQLVCVIVNHMKWDMEQKDFIEMCKIISEKN